MTEYEASRTLVKSPPELWAELSDEASLSGHLAEPFGEIRITRLEPETAVAWEGERASGTVRIEPSGWGTRVILTARAGAGDPPREMDPAPPAPAPPAPEQPAPEPTPLRRPAPPPEPLPPAAAEPEPEAPSEAPRRGLRGLLRGWLGRKQAPPAEPAAPREATDDQAPPTDAQAPPAPEQAPPAEPEPPAQPVATVDQTSDAAPARATVASPSAIDPEAVLAGVLDKLGAAHHRPFSRA